VPSETSGRYAITPLTREDFDQIRAELVDFWGTDHLRQLHHPMFLYEFGDTSLVIREGQRVIAYLLGFTTFNGIAYIHMIAVRRSHQRRSLGHLLYERFTQIAVDRGCRELHAVTTPDNRQSITFHKQIGMQLIGEPGDDPEIPVWRNYAGPGEDRVVFRKQVGNH
jgi:GNAT superfamily N-acetyltransferase